jgi:hypothetical protein
MEQNERISTVQNVARLSMKSSNSVHIVNSSYIRIVANAARNCALIGRYAHIAAIMT